MNKVLILILAIGLTACGTYKALAPNQADVDRGAKKYPGLSMDNLNQGKAIFENECGKCHSLNKPFRVSESALIKIMPTMAKKAGIDSKSSDLVLKYLVTMKSAPKK